MHIFPKVNAYRTDFDEPEYIKRASRIFRGQGSKPWKKGKPI